MLTTENILLLIFAYLIGSFPSSVVIGKIFYGKDIREYGSGNAGATNTFRVLGVRAGVPVLLMDVLKGFIAVNLFYLIDNYLIFSAERLFEIRLTFGIASVIGHLFPLYIGFRGGKGIATMLGLMIGLEPTSALICCIIFIFTFFFFRYVSLSSILSSLAFPLIIIFFLKTDNNSLVLFSIFVPILSLITHQKNIERLLRGEENKAKFDKKK